MKSCISCAPIPLHSTDRKLFRGARIGIPFPPPAAVVFLCTQKILKFHLSESIGRGQEGPDCRKLRPPVLSEQRGLEQGVDCGGVMAV